MPWNERSAMDQRTRFIADYLDDFFPFAELCLRYDISRPTGYKWVQRYIEEGAAGLMDRSRKPSRCPHATSSELVEAILEARHRHPPGAPRNCSPGSNERNRIKNLARAYHCLRQRWSPEFGQYVNPVVALK